MLKRMTIYDHSYIRLSLDIIEFLVTCGNSKDRRRPLIPMRQKKKKSGVIGAKTTMIIGHLVVEDSDPL